MPERFDAEPVGELLRLLTDLQSQNDAIYPDGIFASQRHHPFLPYKREDDNLFFTASVVHILQPWVDHLEEGAKQLAEDIIRRSLKTYRLFQNRTGRDSYNFWQTRPGKHFPNGVFMHRFKHFQIPDDVDDTALVLLTEGADSERVSNLRETLKKHANLAYKQAFNPLPHHRDRVAYSTFFGERMYIEFDICVLSNLMRVILPFFKDQLNEHDRGTLEFIAAAIERGEHRTHPFQTAPNYPTTPLILYHLSRLLPQLPAAYFDRIAAIVSDDVKQLLYRSRGMERVLLENASMKCGNAPIDQSPYSVDVLTDRNFFFFHAGMITAFENIIAQRLASHPFFHLRYTSKALNGALLFENLMLRNLA